MILYQNHGTGANDHGVTKDLTGVYDAGVASPVCDVTSPQHGIASPEEQDRELLVSSKGDVFLQVEG